MITNVSNFTHQVINYLLALFEFSKQLLTTQNKSSFITNAFNLCSNSKCKKILHKNKIEEDILISVKMISI